jgi:outer membrane protein assembly factor BamD
MTYIVNSLAEYEVHVARYYFKPRRLPGRGQPRPAGLADYRDSTGGGRSAVHHGSPYDALGMTQLRDDARRVLDQELPQQRIHHQAASRPTRIRGGSSGSRQAIQHLVKFRA